MQLFGVYAGLVVATNDPQGRRRVRVCIPQITGSTVSGWAEPVSYGTVAPGDKVTVAFEGGDMSYPLYWPRNTETVNPWLPLALEPGWTAADAGTPVYRTTEDGMVELAGSVQTTNAITLGTTVKFASLPAGARPLETYQATTATDYRSAYTSRISYGDYRITLSTTSTTYITDTNGPTVNFTAPGTGTVVIVWGCFSQSSTTAGRCLMSIRVTSGATTLVDGDDDYAAEVQSDANVTGSNSRQMTGLTPGSTYTVTALYRSSDATATASFDNRWMTVLPVGAQNSPSARITLTPSGDLRALFPGGAASPYDMSLTGVRARIV